MKDYMKLIRKFYTDKKVSCTGPSTIYENIDWGTAIPVPQTELDNHCLSIQKMDKIKLIDDKTVTLIDNGFVFDGETFSLSSKAQMNWLGLKSLQSLLTFPINITTMADTSYSLTEANLDLFVTTASGTVQYYLDSGRSIKSQVSAAATEADLLTIQDLR